MVRTYQLSNGLQESLIASLATYLKAHTDDWAQQVNDQIIDDEALTVFVAMGWIPSKRDSRLTLVEAE